MEEVKENLQQVESAQPNDAEFQSRVKDFNGELVPLLKKYRLGIGASAFLLPDGRIAAGPRLYDDTPKAEDAAKPEGESKPAESKLSEG